MTKSPIPYPDSVSNATPPLVPGTVDLRDFPFTPIFRARLFGSSFHARATDSEWRAGVTLWLKSWDQSPAGSLPPDDVDLCRLAELGRDIKAWKKVKGGALHGWVLCDDGRLYHSVVAEGVIEAAKRKEDQRIRTLKARIAALQKRMSQAKDTEAKERITDEINRLSHLLSQTQNSSVTDRVTETKGQGQGQGQGQGDSNKNPYRGKTGSSEVGGAHHLTPGDEYPFDPETGEVLS